MNTSPLIELYQKDEKVDARGVQYFEWLIFNHFSQAIVIFIKAQREPCTHDTSDEYSI